MGSPFGAAVMGQSFYLLADPDHFRVGRLGTGSGDAKARGMTRAQRGLLNQK